MNLDFVTLLAKKSDLTKIYPLKVEILMNREKEDFSEIFCRKKFLENFFHSHIQKVT